nr:condensation domain-containing protein [Paenibacillus polymyxa]
MELPSYRDGRLVLSLVTNEVFASYFAILAHKQPELAPVTPYSQYIEWLEQQDRQAASSYWSKVLEGYEEQSRLSQAKIQGKTGYLAERLDFDLARTSQLVFSA